MTYKEFKEWFDKKADMAEAMSLEANQDPETMAFLIQEVSEAMFAVKDMLEQRKLIYKPTRKR